MPFEIKIRIIKLGKKQCDLIPELAKYGIKTNPSELSNALKCRYHSKKFGDILSLSDGNDTCKSPIGLFSTMYIENDLKMVDESLRIYYSLKPEHKCSDCENVIMPAANRTVQQIVEGTVKNYGRKLCWNCTIKEVNKRKEATANAASDVSGGTGQQGA